MRVDAKARLTEVRVLIGKENPRIFLVPKAKVDAVRANVGELMDAAQDGHDFIPAEEMFPNLAIPRNGPGSPSVPRVCAPR